MEVLRAVRAALPRAVVAAGTVISVEQVRAVKETGVDFVVCPGIDHELVRASQQANLPVIPGVLTPTDVLRALGAGIDTVKVFPVGEVGGPAWIRALSAPFPHLHFVPTGGIRGPDVEAYLSLPSVLAVGGSWLVPPRGSAATPDEISAAARQAWDDAARARRGDS
jgi:2-dehydro-3-deoxyphosphogluconate aldolase/(4S)-4-hydroxy-2-oxoglutarate aldolase